jgi:hypothetical protein
VIGEGHVIYLLKLILLELKILVIKKGNINGDNLNNFLISAYKHDIVLTNRIQILD